MTLLIRNLTIVTATDQYVGDVFIEGEKITTIDKERCDLWDPLVLPWPHL